MVSIRFTYYAKRMSDGRHKVNMYIKDVEPTWDDTPRNERLAMKEAAKLVHEIVDENCDPEKFAGQDRMLCPGDPTDDAFPVFMFVIGINWNRDAKTAHYSRVCYQRIEMDGMWNPVAALGMEQFDYTMGILKKLEKKILKAKEIENGQAHEVHVNG